MMTFKEQLQEARKAAGLSQEQVAKLMNMSRQGVSHWENDRALPDAETLKKLSQVLNYNFEEIESAGTETTVEAPAEETPEVLEAVKPERKQHTTVLCIICLAVGLAVGFLMGYLAAPKFVNQTLAIPTSNRSSDAAQAAISIYTDESPVMLRYPSEDSELAYWFYNVNIEETAGVQFTIEKVETVYIHDNGDEGQKHSFTPQDLLLSDGVIVAWGKVSFGGGLPSQSLKGIRVTVHGTDAKGNQIIMEQFLPFSKQLAE